MAFNLTDKQRADRKLLLTVVEWNDGSQKRQLLGHRIESSNIEYNHDITTQTDILGENYTDVNKSQPQQSFEPYTITGGDALAEFLNDKRRRNALSELNVFTVYVITAFKGSAGEYEAEKHTDCTIVYNSIGGDTKTDMPITVYFSNKITLGTVDKLTEDFAFTPDTPATTTTSSQL
jgi:hypothetical protein